MFTVTECLDILTLEKLLSTCTSANLAWRNPLRQRQGCLRAWLAEYREAVAQKRFLRAIAPSVYRTLSYGISPELEAFLYRYGMRFQNQDLTELMDEALNRELPALHVECVAAGLQVPDGWRNPAAPLLGACARTL